VAGANRRPTTARPAEEEPTTSAPAAEPGVELSANGVLAPEPEAAESPRPTPGPRATARAKARTEPKPEAATEPEPEPEPEPAEKPAPAVDLLPPKAKHAKSKPTEPAPKGWLLPVALVLVAAVLTVAGFWFRAEYLQAESGGSNQALVDTARTSEVVGQVTTAIQTVLSYNFAEPTKNEQAAKDVLIGKATQDYDTILTGLRKTGPEQKLVYSTIVRSAAVRVLEDDRAMVLVFADQHSERASDGYRGDTALQVVVNAQQVDGKWKITEIQPR
ncbi:hypothetical protein, partial [Crossiella equi]